MRFTLFLLFAAIFSMQTAVNAQNFIVGDTYDLEFIPLLDDDKYYVSGVGESILVFNFWFIGCTGCELELDYLNQIKKEYQDKDVRFLSVTGSTGESLDKFLEKRPIEWEIIDNVAMVEKFTDHPTFSPRCYPTTMIVDRDREVVYSKCYPLTSDNSSQEFREVLDVALQE
ncbi:MAG: TlpA disulfide reductase family protein [Bacteroidota bacterium]